MNQSAIRKSFGGFLKEQALKLTAQRARIFDRAFATHEHFTAEQLYAWLKSEAGPSVSRATVYRTLSVLVEGGFLESLDTGSGELHYEHVLGHHHHDHLLCLGCGRIEEFCDERIEALQLEVCVKKGFQLVHHDLRLSGYCRVCQRAGKAKKPAPRPAPGR